MFWTGFFTGCALTVLIFAVLVALDRRLARDNRKARGHDPDGATGG